MPIASFKRRITDNSTTTVVSVSCYVQQITITCGVPGTSWSLKIQDKDSPVSILIPEFTLAQPPDGYPNVHFGGLNFQAIPMIGGIDIITAGGSGTREVSVWLVLIQ
jgi:hypothetical protein